MSKPINDGGPAFPASLAVGPDCDLYSSTDYPSQSGMTLRDYFAAAVLPSCYSSVIRVIEMGESEALSQIDGGDAKQQIVIMAYELADAMLAERTK